MPIIKNEIPILEYDDKQLSVLMPNREGYKLPKRAVFAFLGDAIGGEEKRLGAEAYARKNGFEKVAEFCSSTKVYPVFKTLYKGEEVCIVQAPVGAPAAVQILDFLVYAGCEKIISTGSCGTLVDREENEFLIPIEALRCEGTSYHYLPPSRTVKANEKVVNIIQEVFKEKEIKYELCKTWTTDGFFRETAEMVEYRKSEGFSVVEMETAALFACSEFRIIDFGQILFTADSLANIESHDERDWGLESYELALSLCFDIVVKM